MIVDSAKQTQDAITYLERLLAHLRDPTREVEHFELHRTAGVKDVSWEHGSDYWVYAYTGEISFAISLTTRPRPESKVDAA